MLTFLKSSGIDGVSLHSFRNGAQEYLERLVPAEDAAALTGHMVSPTTVPGMRSYRPIRPHSAHAQTSLRISTMLVRAIRQA